MLYMSNDLLKRFKLWQESDVPGACIWFPNGQALKESFSRLCCRAFSRAGYLKVFLPYFIPKDIYQKQPEHFEGLLPYTFLVSGNGGKEYYLRTTSETPFTQFFQNMSETDKMPYLYFQEVTVFRNENYTYAPVRSVEIHPFIESYSAVATENEATSRIFEEVTIYKKILQALDIPFIISKRPPYDTFPEAKYTIAFDAVLPDNRVVQVATVHHLGTSFAEAFGWKIGRHLPIQTSTGISCRALATCVYCHISHDGNLILPNSLWADLPDKTADISFYPISRNRTYHQINFKSLETIDQITRSGHSIPQLLCYSSLISLVDLRDMLPEGYSILGTGIRVDSKNKRLHELTHIIIGEGI